MTSTLSGGMHDGDDVLVSHGQIEQLRSERTTAERPLLGQKVIPDCRPAVMRARKGIAPRQVPDGVLVEALPDCGQVPSRHRHIQVAHHSHILRRRHHDPPLSRAASASRR